MKVIQTSNLTPGSLDPDLSHYVYNGLDAMVTHQIFPILQDQLVFKDPHSSETLDHTEVYNFKLSCQAVALEMMTRGILVDQEWREKMEHRYQSRINHLREVMNLFGIAATGKKINPRSHHQLKHLFYNVMGLPKQYAFTKGERRLTTDRKALETLSAHRMARPMCNTIILISEMSKKLERLHKLVDPDGRMRTSYNIGGTETDRWSSSESILGTGDNMQNWTNELRRMFIADPGMKLGYPDFAQAESYCVGLLVYRDTGDSKFLDAVQSGDIHTQVAKLCWPELGWSNDPKENRQLADRPFYRHFSYRDIAKRGGHKLDYALWNAKPYATSRQLSIPVGLAAEFHQRYYGAFPAIPAWQRACIRKVQTAGRMTTLLGLTRFFWSNRDDEATWREAIAFEPQSIVGQATNVGLCKIQAEASDLIQLLGQTHDAALLQFPEEREEEAAIRSAELMSTTLSSNGRSVTIPVEFASGWNWAKEATEKDVEEGRAKEPNLDGVKDWTGNDSRQRQYFPKSILHRTVRSRHEDLAIA